MDMLEGLKKNNIVTNTKGSKYYRETYDANLDVFTALSRYNQPEEVVRKFHAALLENENLALANLLFLLDIRSGKGERLLFKTIFKDLCDNYPDLARKVLPLIGELGRYDYILVGLNSPIEKDVLSLIKDQLELDIKSENPSLLAKWLPSHRSHNVNNKLAKTIISGLGITEKEYRKTLSKLRSKINIVEKNLTEENYALIELSEIPTKAMLKYTKTFMKKMPDDYLKYLADVREGKSKINTTGLFCYEIVKKILFNSCIEEELLDLMWKNQKDVLGGINKNILVVADTSGSMTCCGCLPLATALGLAIYTAERNTGIFKDYFITFSREPRLEHVVGTTIKEKVSNIEPIISNTDIDKVFELLLNTALENKLGQQDMPEFIVIISDMEFDSGVMSKNKTNFTGWKNEFQNNNYFLPKIIFWNVAADIKGVPVTKYDSDVVMLSGFSTNLLENIFTLENYTPKDAMFEKLNVYLDMLNVDNS